LSLAEWGRWDDELDEVTLATLQISYVRRQQMVARMTAVAVVNALSEGMGGGREEGIGDRGLGMGASGGMGMSASGRRYRRVSPEVFMREAGIKRP
jgi:hypothetical protein